MKIKEEKKIKDKKLCIRQQRGSLQEVKVEGGNKEKSARCKVRSHHGNSW